MALHKNTEDMKNCQFFCVSELREHKHGIHEVSDLNESHTVLLYNNVVISLFKSVVFNGLLCLLAKCRFVRREFGYAKKLNK